MNDRITKKERGLLKGAIRRVFSRSELRKQVLDAYETEHVDPKRPRVNKWAWCSVCGEVSPKYKMQVDHQDPVVEIHSSLEQMTWDELVDRIWCERNNLTVMCISCHTSKSKLEMKARRAHKKGLNK